MSYITTNGITLKLLDLKSDGTLPDDVIGQYIDIVGAYTADGIITNVIGIELQDYIVTSSICNGWIIYPTDSISANIPTSALQNLIPVSSTSWTGSMNINTPKYITLGTYIYNNNRYVRPIIFTSNFANIVLDFSHNSWKDGYLYFSQTNNLCKAIVISNSGIIYGQAIYGEHSTRSLPKAVAQYINDNLKEGEPPTDPYNLISDTSSTGGGGGIGTASDTSDSIDFPDVPTLTAVATGFINLYVPTLAQLQALASFMWSSAFDLDTLKKLFSDPMQSILGLSILGVQAPTGSDKTVVVGDISTGVSMTALADGGQYFKVNCGSLNIQEIWGAYIDYAPYTKVSIYLPFIGTHALNIDEIMSKTIELEYMFDALSGACIANIKSGSAVLYSFIGQCSASLPISGNDYTSMINGVLGIAGAVGSMVATGGATAPLVLPGVAATAVNSLKPNIEHSGAISGTGGIMGIKQAYLIFERPRQCLPSNQNKYIGYPSYITENIGDLSGFTVFEDIKIQGNSHMTMGEIEEVEAILKSGVYL